MIEGQLPPPAKAQALRDGILITLTTRDRGKNADKDKTSRDRIYKLTVDTTHSAGVLEGLNEWFEVSPEFVTQLNAEYRYRTVLPLRTEQIRRVTIRHGDQNVVIHREDNGRYADAIDADVDPAIGGALFDTLAGLRAERFVKPLHLPADATTVIEIETLVNTPSRTETAGSTDAVETTYRLVICNLAGHKNTATLNNQWFTLDQQTLEQLRVPLTIATHQEQPG